MYFKIDNTHWLHTYSSTKVRRFSRAYVGAGGLPFKKPITDNETLDATTDSGLYQVSGFSSIPYGILIVFEGSNLVCQKLIGSASILFRMKSKTSSWPVWKELKGVEHQTIL